MATSPEHPARTVERNRALLANLIKQMPSAERDRFLERHAVYMQGQIDLALGMLAVLGTEPPASRPGRKPKSYVSAAAPDVQVVRESALPCAHEHEPVDASSVPAAVRAVLANERTGLLVPAIVAGVQLLRPNTMDASVHGAVFHMRKRGELVREGYHKNYRYALVSCAALRVPSAANTNGEPTGGQTH
jgi:hypothetical protein